MNNKETIEEAAERYATGKSSSDVFKKAHIRDFIEGAKWQQEQDKNKYSEEEVFRLLVHSNERYGKRSVTTQCIKTWFELFKNK
jgi:hypothetical protein